MPRKASDKTITHRFELGLTERKQVEQIAKDQLKQQKIRSISNAIGGISTGIGSMGFLFAGLALSAYLAPKLIKETYEKSKDLLDKVSTEILTPVVDPVTNDLVQNYKDSVDVTSQARNEVNQFCTPSSIDYDIQKCAIAQNNLRDAQANQKAQADRIQSITSEIQDLSIFDFANPIGTLLGLANSAKIPKTNTRLEELREQYGVVLHIAGSKFYYVDTDGDGQADTYML